MSLCDVCTRPGRCCFGFELSGVAGDTALEVLAQLASIEGSAPDRGPDATELGVPFVPLWRRPDGRWLCWCPVLDPRSGRCTAYADRPYPCRSYAPGHDALCAMRANAITAPMSTLRIGGPP